MLLNVELYVCGKKDYLIRFLTLLTLLILNGMVKTKLAILPILWCKEIVKNSIGFVWVLYLNSTDESNMIEVTESFFCISNSQLAML